MFDSDQVFEYLEEMEDSTVERYEALGLVTRHFSFEEGIMEETYALTEPGEEYFLG